MGARALAAERRVCQAVPQSSRGSCAPPARKCGSRAHLCTAPHRFVSLEIDEREQSVETKWQLVRSATKHITEILVIVAWRRRQRAASCYPQAPLCSDDF